MAPAYFEALYGGETDPWGFDTSLYEAEKYAATLRALPHARYHRALEIGCANGALSERLAPRCDALVAIDVAPAVVARATERLACFSHLDVRCAGVPSETPEGPFDLVVLSEVGYYLSRADLDALRVHLADAIPPGGDLVLVHWTGETDYPLSADAVHSAFLLEDAWAPVGIPEPIGIPEEAPYRLDVLRRTGT